MGGLFPGSLTPGSGSPYLLLLLIPSWDLHLGDQLLSLIHILAPTVVAGALKGAVFAANLYEKLGFGVVPNGSEGRHDIIQAITFGTPEGVIRFCEGIQAAAPVDSFVTVSYTHLPGGGLRAFRTPGGDLKGQ